MGRIVVTEFVSLDGVMEDPGGSEDFAQGGWSFEISRGDEGDKFKLDETVRVRGLAARAGDLRGLCRGVAVERRRVRRQVQHHAQVRRLLDPRKPEWNNSTVLKGDVAEEVAKLRREQDGDIVVHGSARLVRALVEHDLVDELRLMVYPVVLGGGKRLFGETSGKKRLRLVDTKMVGEGVAILIYPVCRTHQSALRIRAGCARFAAAGSACADVERRERGRGRATSGPAAARPPPRPCPSRDAAAIAAECCRTRSRSSAAHSCASTAHDPERLRREVSRVVLHEVPHHFGISDERLVEIDRY